MRYGLKEAPITGIEFPLAGDEVDGLRVGEDVPNTASIRATFTEYEVLTGIRELSFSDFGGPETVFYAPDDKRRARELAEEIRESGWVAPLIIAVDEEGPYILEGAHRFVALHGLGKKYFPALVVLDRSTGTPATESRLRLDERLSDVLYHLNSLSKTNDILKSDTFLLSTFVGSGADSELRSRKKGQLYFMSAARSPRSRFFKYVGASQTILVLDGRKLGHRYAGSPVDYWGPEFRAIDPESTEMEDRLWSREPEIPNFSSYINEIHVFLHKDADKPWLQHELTELAALSESRGVPVYLYENEQAFKLLDKRRALSLDEVNLTRADEYKPSSWSRKIRLYEVPAWLELLEKSEFSELSDDAQKILNRIQGARVPFSKWDRFRRETIIQLKNELHGAKQDKEIRPLIRGMQRLGVESVEDFAVAMWDKWHEQFNAR